MSAPQPGTPTPWVVEEGHIQRDSNGIRYWQITDGQDAIACNQFCYAGYDPAVNAANAAAIVHRVNNWDALEAERDALQARVDALVELLREGMVIADQIAFDFKYPPSADSQERRIERADKWSDRVEDIIAASAKGDAA